MKRVSELKSTVAFVAEHYTQGDSDVSSMSAGFRRHLVGKTLINVFYCDITEIQASDHTDIFYKPTD